MTKLLLNGLLAALLFDATGLLFAVPLGLLPKVPVGLLPEMLEFGPAGLLKLLLLVAAGLLFGLLLEPVEPFILLLIRLSIRLLFPELLLPCGPCGALCPGWPPWTLC